MKIYFDENFPPALALGFAAFQSSRVSETVEVLHIATEFGKGTDDEEWIPKVAQQHGVAITIDKDIHRTKSQWALCQRHKIGIFFLRPPKKKNYTYWELISEILKHWRDIKEHSKNDTRPFGYEMRPRSAKPIRLAN